MKLKDIQSRADWARKTIAQGMAGMRTRSALSAVLLSLATLGQAAAQISEAASQTNVMAIGQTQSPASSKSECVKVSIDITPFEVSRNYETSIKGLAEIRIAAGAQGAVGSADLGMVFTRRNIKVSSHVDAQGCAVHHVVAGYTPATLYVASELRRSECAFRHVLEHEEHHLTIYKKSLELLSKEASGPLLEKAKNAVKGISLKKAIDKLEEIFHEEFDEIRRRHDDFDSPEEYARNSTVCGRAIPRITIRGN